MLLRYWFPISLILLLVLALPSLILFTMDLVGYEGQSNQWLEDRFNLSHHVPLNDWAAGILFLVPPLLILLYFLKLKRKPMPVPSTFLWQKSIEDLHVNRLMQWLRRNVLLLLQLLIILALLYAIIGPRLHGANTPGRHYILVIDNSASMSARDQGEQTRLEWAKEQALNTIDAATDSDFGMVIVFNSAAEIRQSYTSSQARLRQAVGNIEPTQRPTRIDEALRLAESLANPLRSTEDEAVRPSNLEPGQGRTYVFTEGIPTEVHLFSDGRFADVPDFALANLNMSFHLAGTKDRTDNIAIVNFDAIRDEAIPQNVQVYARVLNYRAEAVTLTLRLDVYINGELTLPLDRRVTIPPRSPSPSADPNAENPPMEPGEQGIFFDLSDIERNTDVRMNLRMIDADDIFPLDDQAWLVLGIVRKTRLLVVTQGNPALEFFFNAPSTRQLAEVTYITPAQLNDQDAYLDPARNGEFDLVVFDNCAPANEIDLPRANTFFIGQPPPPWNREMLEKVEFPQVRGWSDEHAVMRGLRGWHLLEIAEAYRLADIPERAPRLLEGEENLVLLTALTRGAYTDLILAFPLLTQEGQWNTRWFLKPSFVLFLRNLLYSMGNVRDATTEEPVQPGDLKRIRPAGAVEEIRVTSADGETQRLQRGNRSEFVFSKTDEVGIYQVQWDNEHRFFAVNLFDENESNLEPREQVKIGDATIQASEGEPQPRELWKWFVLAGLIFLLVEWYIYNRRVYV